MAGKDQAAMEGSRKGKRIRGWGGTCREREERLGYQVRGKAGPGNTAVRELLSDRRYVRTALDFLRKTGVGMVEAGVIAR